LLQPRRSRERMPPPADSQPAAVGGEQGDGIPPRPPLVGLDDLGPSAKAHHPVFQGLPFPRPQTPLHQHPRPHSPAARGPPRPIPAPSQPPPPLPPGAPAPRTLPALQDQPLPRPVGAPRHHLPPQRLPGNLFRPVVQPHQRRQVSRAQRL